jgi:hypothetical protein
MSGLDEKYVASVSFSYLKLDHGTGNAFEDLRGTGTRETK